MYHHSALKMVKRTSMTNSPQMAAHIPRSKSDMTAKKNVWWRRLTGNRLRLLWGRDSVKSSI